MKGKKLSKVLAILLAVVMIFTTLPLMAFAADEAATYTVSFGAPAIPMNVNTKVDLKTLNVEMVKGATAVSGANITWAADYQDGLTFDAVNKTVKVTKAGNYKLTATVDGVTKNVWVIAKEVSQDKFYLVNIPTLNADTFVAEDWAAFGSYNKTNVTVEEAIDLGYVSFANDYMKLLMNWGTATAEKKGGTVVYVNEIFNDFVDYTVETLTAATPDTSLAVDQLGSGVGGRIALDENGTAYTTGVLAYIRQCKTVAINRTGMDYGPHGVDQGKGSDNKYHTWENNQFHKVVGIFDGANVKYSYESETLFDSSTTSPCCSNAKCILKNVQPTAGYPAMVGWGAVTYFKSFYVYLNSNEMPAPMVDDGDDSEDPTPGDGPATIYEVESFDPVIVMYNNTSANLANITVQLEDGGTAYPATDVNWTVPTTDGLEIADGKINAYTNGTYVVTAKVGNISKNIYILVTDKHKDEIVIFSDDFSNKTLDYSVWQQTEYYWGEAKQVTSQKPYSDKYIEGVNNAQLGAIPFVTKDYWDALRLGGPRSSSEAGGTGYDASKIFMFNAYYYAYIREDYVSEDGIKLSDLGVYNVSLNFEHLNPGNNFQKYTASNNTYGAIASAYNGFGVMGRIDFADQTYYKKGSSTMQSFMYDAKGTTGTKQLVIETAEGTKTSTATGAGHLNAYSFGSFNVKYRNESVSGTYIPTRNDGSIPSNASYSFSAKATANNGSVGFFTECQDLDVFDFTVSYPVSVPSYVDINVTADNNEVTVPLYSTIDLTKYTFSFGGKTVTGKDVAWSSGRKNNGGIVGEVDAIKKTFTAFSVGTTTISGVTFVVTDSVSTMGTKKFADVKGNGDITVVPVGSSNNYKVTAIADNGYLLKAGAISVTYADGTVKTVPVDANGVATIVADTISDVKIVAEFIEKQELGFVSLGATVRVAKAGTTAGVKFGARANNIRLNGGKAILDSEVTINGVDYKVAEIGSIIIPTKLNEDTELTVNTKYVKKTKATVVSNASENFADITAVLTEIPEIWYGLDISFRGYIKYTNLDGTGVYYVYTEEIQRSYNNVIEVAPVSETGVTYNTANTTVMLTSAKANLKYALGEDMIVFVDTYINATMANGINLKYSIYAGNTDGYSGAAIATGTAVSSADASVKISYATQTAGYYYMVVSALSANGSVVVTDTIRLGTGLVSLDGTGEFDDNHIMLSFGVASDTHIREKYSNSAYNRHFEALLKVINNQAGYYTDGTQKLDAFLIAGDLTNALVGNTNLNGLPKDAQVSNALEFNYLAYSEASNLRDMLNNGIGDAQVFYSLGNHDTMGGGKASYTGDPFTFRSTLYYQQIFSGKRVELPDASGLSKGYDKSLLFEGMTDAEKQKLMYNVNDDYTNTKDYIKYFGRDEESAQEFAYGNRVMKINGITFVSLQHTILQNGFARYTDATLRFLKDALDESVANDPSAPVFIITHFRPYGTLGFHSDPVDAGSVNIDEILKDYPQAVIWGGHEHDSLLSETAIVQTRVVDENGNVLEDGFTSVTTAASAYNSDDVFDYGNKVYSSYTQLVQVDINGNIQITKYLVSSPIAGQGSTTTSGKEIVQGTDGQWTKSWTTNSAQVVTNAASINDPWYIINAVDDNVRDEYAVDTRAAYSKPQFTSTDVTVSGKIVTFSKAVNALGINTADTVIYTYRVQLYNSSGGLSDTIYISAGPQQYSNYYDVPISDTYSVTVLSSTRKVVITAFDCWAAYYDHSRYPSITVNISQ